MSKVPGHVDLNSPMTDEERYNAVGNDFADRVAKAAAAALPRPSDAEQQEWQNQQSFLERYCQLVPLALMQWPAAGPSQGHKSLPKRADPTDAPRRSFREDLLGPWRDPDGEGGAASSELDLGGGGAHRGFDGSALQERAPKARLEVAGGAMAMHELPRHQ